MNVFRLSVLSVMISSFQLFKKQLILQGHIFDCSDYKQAGTFINTLKQISKYFGTEYIHGGNIQLPYYPQAQPL
jgi:hypothetical protein